MSAEFNCSRRAQGEVSWELLSGGTSGSSDGCPAESGASVSSSDFESLLNRDQSTFIWVCFGTPMYGNPKIRPLTLFNWMSRVGEAEGKQPRTESQIGVSINWGFFLWVSL